MKKITTMTMMTMCGLLDCRKEVITVGEYNRLNKMLRKYELALAQAKLERVEPEIIADLEVEIGEIKGSLLEMAEVDGLDDPYEAFDYDYSYEDRNYNRLYSD